MAYSHCEWYTSPFACEAFTLEWALDILKNLLWKHASTELDDIFDRGPLEVS